MFTFPISLPLSLIFSPCPFSLLAVPLFLSCFHDKLYSLPPLILLSLPNSLHLLPVHPLLSFMLRRVPHCLRLIPFLPHSLGLVSHFPRRLLQPLILLLLSSSPLLSNIILTSYAALFSFPFISSPVPHTSLPLSFSCLQDVKTAYV